MKRLCLPAIVCGILTFVLLEVLRPGNRILYAAVTGAVIALTLCRVLVKRPAKYGWVVLLCLVYLRFNVASNLGSATFHRFDSEYLYIPLGALAYWITEMVKEFKALRHGK